MKVSYLALAATLAATANGAVAETGVKIDRTDNVANVYGRAGVPNARISGPAVVTRPAQEVPSGSTTVEGPTAVATVTRNPDVNEVRGRSRYRDPVKGRAPDGGTTGRFRCPTGLSTAQIGCTE